MALPTLLHCAADATILLIVHLLRPGLVVAPAM